MLDFLLDSEDCDENQAFIFYFTHLDMQKPTRIGHVGFLHYCRPLYLYYKVYFF